MALIKVTNIAAKRSIALGRNKLIHPGESVFAVARTPQIAKLEGKGLVSVEVIEQDSINPAGGFSSLREELSDLYETLNESRNLGRRNFGSKD